MTFLKRDQAFEFQPHYFSTEASDLELGAGEWPEQIATELGNGHPLMRSSKKLDAEGDLMWVTYRQCLGCITVRIYND